MLSTGQLAKRLGVSRGQVITAVSRNGEFFGIRPTRADNGRSWLWPEDAPTRLGNLPTTRFRIQGGCK